MTDDAVGSGRTASPGWRLAVAMGFALAALGAWNWILSPDQPIRWLRGMLYIPFAWGVIALLRGLAVRWWTDGRPIDTKAARRYSDSALRLVVVGGGPMLVGYALAIWAAEFGSIGPDARMRAVAFTTGGMFMVVGNMVPKILTPLSMLPPGRAGRQQEARRFVGLILVLLGFTVVVASILAPVAYVPMILETSVVVLVLATLAAIVWMNVAPSLPEGES